jgi:hypothetical protein
VKLLSGLRYLLNICWAKAFTSTYYLIYLIYLIYLYGVPLFNVGKPVMSPA